MRRWAAAGAALIACALSAAPAAAQTLTAPPRAVYVVRVDGWSLARLLADPTVASLAASGGAALMPDAGELVGDATTSSPGPAVRDILASSDASVALVVVASVTGVAGTPLAPVVVASGAPADLLAAAGTPRALTSASTHRAGVVAPGDLAAAIAAFQDGAPALGDAVSTAAAAPPLALERRFLERAKSAVPIELALVILVTVIGLGAIAVLARGSAPRPLVRALAWGAMAVPGLGLSLLLVGHLPSLTAATALPAIAVGTLAIALAASPARPRTPTVIGAVVLAGLVVEAATGWCGALLPFLGGSQLDGARYYGLPNAFIGLLVGAALYVAWRLPRGAGTAVVAATAVLAGFPYLGSNLGGAITASFAAGAWWSARRGDGLGPRALATGIVAAAAGAAIVALAHALSPEPTHITAAVRGGNLIATYLHRLDLALTMLREHPASIIPALGAPALLVAALRPAPPLARGFASAPGSRDVVAVLAAAGVVAFLANDSGASAAGLAFGLGLALALWVSLRAMTGEPA